MDTADKLERAFGRGRVRMATGSHVEVYREPAAEGERRRYTKRFLATDKGDFREWTEREWRILARLFGHGVAGVAEVVHFDRGQPRGAGMVQTYDAGITVDHWLTLLPMTRDGRVVAHVFEDCAHWWALAHHCVRALASIHRLQLVHLDLKADNVCIPADPPDFDPRIRIDRVKLDFERLALIDFAFSLVSGERLHRPLPIGTESGYRYQSPRLVAALEAGRRGDLGPTQALDWRCDFYSLAAMLERCLPRAERRQENGWSATRPQRALDFIAELRACHDAALPDPACHDRLLEMSAAISSAPDLTESLARGWQPSGVKLYGVRSSVPATPLTRIAPVAAAGGPVPAAAAEIAHEPGSATLAPTVVLPAHRAKRSAWLFGTLAVAAVALLGTQVWSLRGEPARIETATMDAPAAGARVDREPSAPAVAAAGESTPQSADETSPYDDEDAAMRPKRNAASERAASEPAKAPAVERAAREPVVAAAKTRSPSEPPASEPSDARQAPGLESGELDEKAAKAVHGLVARSVRTLERRVHAVLAVAGDSEAPSHDRAIYNAATQSMPSLTLPDDWPPVDARSARRLNAAASRAYWNGNDPTLALRLQRRAFAANPLDPEVAGNFAFYQLRANPPDPERARELALHALAVRGEQFPAGRIEDWTSFAVASALLGRPWDAQRAFFVVLALSQSLERSCRIALGSGANYGRRVEGPARAMLARVHARGRSAESPFCTWPPDWSAEQRSPQLAGSSRTDDRPEGRRNGL